MLESWQVFHAALKVLPKGTIQSIYTQKSRMFYYWGSDGKTSKQKQNPIDRIRQLLFELYVAGRGEYARWAIDYMAEPLGGRFTDRNAAKTDKGSIEGEVADIAMALGDLVHNIQARKEDIRIKKSARHLVRQVEQLLDAAGIKQKGK